MLWSLVISLGVALIMVGGWYLIFSRYNRKQGFRVLRWLEAALDGQGHVTGVRWLGPSRFHVPLRFFPSVFQRAAVVVQLAPRELPFQWLARLYDKQPDTLTFEADLDCAPRFNLEIHNHRWCGRTRRLLPPDPDKWEVERVGPIVLSSRSEWQKEVSAMLNSLLGCRDRDFLKLAIRRQSPHFSAIVPLASIAPDAETRGQIFELMRELASGVSASSF